MPDDSVDLVFTSPPYADQRKNSYGGIAPDEYVEWFLPVSEQLLRVLKPTGSFVLNIKERVVSGERNTYVMELIMAMRDQGWLWTEEYIWHKEELLPRQVAQQIQRRLGTPAALHQIQAVLHVSRSSDGADGRLEERSPAESQRSRQDPRRVKSRQRLRQEHLQLGRARHGLPDQCAPPRHRVQQQKPQRSLPRSPARMVHQALHQRRRHRARPVHGLRNHQHSRQQNGPTLHRHRNNARIPHPHGRNPRLPPTQPHRQLAMPLLWHQQLRLQTRLRQHSPRESRNHSLLPRKPRNPAKPASKSSPC